jgi:hypothetical protein
MCASCANPYQKLAPLDQDDVAEVPEVKSETESANDKHARVSSVLWFSTTVEKRESDIGNPAYAAARHEPNMHPHGQVLCGTSMLVLEALMALISTLSRLCNTEVP